MKYTSLLRAAGLACALIATVPAHAAAEHAMIGCLAKGSDAGTFMLTNVEGASTVAIAESSADLSGHVGHKVEITGVAVDGKDPKVHTMKVSSMKHIAGTCP